MDGAQGKYWPTETDMQPLSVRYWVQRTDSDGGYDGFSNVVFTENDAAVERRLCDQFRLYRAAQAAKRAIVGWAEGFTV